MTKAKSLTRPELVAAVQNVAKTIERWEAANTDTAPFVQWRGRPTKAISEALVEAFEGLFDLVDTVDIDITAHAIALEIDRFMATYERWAELSELSPEEASPSGSAEVWAAWRDVVSSTAERPVKNIESIEQLDVEKVSDRQIAMIYGWRQSDGSPDIQKVREERKEPGKHFNRETWVHPQDAKDAAEVAARWAERQLRISDRDAMAEAPMAPETLDELIMQDVPSKQIAMILKIDVSEVKARAAALNVPLDGQFVPSVSPHDRMQDIRDADAKRRSELSRTAVASQTRAAETDPAAMPERVLSLAADGMNPKQIAKLLSDDYKGLTESKVAAILAHAKANPVEV